MAYEVNVGLYDGPLSLLVELSKHRLLDVFLIKLQGIAAEYRAWVKAEEHASLNVLAEPLPLIGQLIAIKARLLLPAPQLPEEEQDETVSLEELQRRLREYEQFKTVSHVLAELHTLQHDRLTRQVTREEPPEKPSGPLSVGLIDLMSAFAKVLENNQVSTYEVETEAWTVEQKVDELRMLLMVRKKVGFTDMFSPKKSTLELVCTFLALLELVRQRVCEAVQEQHFGAILIIRREITLGGAAEHGPGASQTDS
jgi:segregation and condensation protein A